MPDFFGLNAQNSISAEAAPQTPLGKSSSSSWLQGGAEGLVAPLQEHTPALGPRYSLFSRPHHLAPKPKSQTAYVPKDAMLSSHELVPPHFLDQRYAPGWAVLIQYQRVTDERTDGQTSSL